MTRHWFRKKDGRARAVGTLFDDAVVMLEDRVMLDAVPTVTVDAPATALLTSPANTVTVGLTFDNTGTDPGYGPYIELILPQNGNDGFVMGNPTLSATTTGDDGATFVSATYLGSAVNVITNTTFNAAGTAVNTLTGDTITGNPGDQLVVLQLPFGSYTGPQTPASIVLNLSLSPNADLNVALPISARGGFQYGLDALANEMSDPHIRGTTSTDSFLPSLATLVKSASVPNDREAEISTGPNFPFTYTVSVDVADGQTLTNVNLVDFLPDTIVFQGNIQVSIGGVTATAGVDYTIVDAPVVGTVVDPADNALRIALTNPLVAPVGVSADVVLRFDAYVSDLKADNSPVINPTTGATTLTQNQAAMSSNWIPFDPGDPTQFFLLNATEDPAHPGDPLFIIPTPAPENSFQNQPIVLQKTSVIATDVGPAGLSPGDVVEYTLNIQVSDYFSVGDISLNDILSDGQRLDTSFAPTLTVVERGATLTTGTMSGVATGAATAGDVTAGMEFTGNFASTFSPVTGVTTSTINISSALVAIPTFLGTPGVLSGGRVLTNAGATTVQVKFRAVVQDNYESDAVAAGQRAVDQGDAISNTVQLSGSIRDNFTGATTLNAQSIIDDADDARSIERGALTKTIYAINGNTNLASFVVDGQTQIKAGDLITYRLTYTLPISSFENLYFNDFLPLPVLVAQNMTLNTSAPAYTAGEYAYGPTDTFHLLAGATVPTDSFDTTGNSVTFSYPDYSAQNIPIPNENRTIDIVFTLRIQDTNFADGLFLTNLATSNESNTVGNALANNQIVQFQLAQPNLLIQKAIVSSSAGTITTPQTVTGLTFGAPGSGTGFTDTGGPLTDTRLGLTAAKGAVAAPNINSNLTGVDAGDTARVALVINNEGGNDAYDVVFGDMLAPGTAFAGGTIDNAASHLEVRTGAGTLLTLGVDYNITGNTATTFQITMLNNAAGHSIGKDGVTDGSDILVVTYDIALTNVVPISPTTLTSSGTVTNYTALAGGTDLSFVDPTDAATINVTAPTVQKLLVGGSSTSASTTEPAITIGEQQSYTITYTFPEGSLSTVKLFDLISNNATDGRYEIVSATVTSIGANLKQSVGGAAVNSAYIGAAVLSSTGGTYLDTATFGGAGILIVNEADNSTDANDSITITVVVRAVDHADNTNGKVGSNLGLITYGGGGAAQSIAAVSIAVPNVAIDKSLVTTGPIDAGDTVEFDITVTHVGGTIDAFDVNISDILPAGLTTLNVVSVGANPFGLSTGSFSTAGNTLTLVTPIASMSGTQSFTVRISAVVDNTASAGGTLVNNASVIFSTLPGTVTGERVITNTDPANVPFTAVQTIVKTITATDVAATGTVRGGAGPDLLPGETGTFEIVVTLPEGITSSVVISDILQNALGRLDLVGVPVVTLGTGITFSGAGTYTAGADGNGDGLPDGFSYNFGNVTVPGDNIAGNNTITITYNAKLLDVPANAAGNQSSPTATLNSALGTLTSTTPYDIVQPLVTITKDANLITTAASGDTVQYTAVITAVDNATSANAQDVVFTDALGGGATVTGDVVIDGVAIAVGASGTVGGQTVSVVASGSGFTIRFGEMTTAAGANHSHTIVYNATVAAGAGSTVNSNATVTYDGIDSGGASTADAQADRNLSASDDAPIGTISIAKAVTATSVADTGTAQVRAGVDDLAIGETAAVQITVNVPAGARTFNVADLMDLAGIGRVTAGVPTITPGAGVVFATAPVVTNPDLDADGNPDLNIAFSMGAGSAAGTITITYTATAANVAGNAGGDQLNLPVTLTYAAAAGVTGTQSASVSVDIVEPALVIDKSIMTSDPTPNAGDTVSYTIVVTNNGTGPAYDVLISDPFPAGLTLVPGTSTLVLSMGGGTTNPANPQAVTVAALMPGQSATLTYSVVIGNSAVTGVPITNTATIAASGTLPGGGGRAGPNPSDSTSFTVEANQGLDKAIATTTDGNTGTGAFRPGVIDLGIGETATIDLTVRLTEGSTNSVVLVDKLHLPAGTLTLSAPPTIITANGITFTGTGAAGYTLTDTDGDGVPDTITMDFGTVTVPGNNDPSDNFFIIRYTGLLGDRPENQAGDQIDLGATLTTALGTASAATMIDVVAPAVTLTKAASAGFVSRGDVVSYTITLTNAGTGPAYDLSLADVLPAGLSYVAGTTSLTVGGVTTTFASPNAVTFAMLGSGQTAVVSYQVRVDAAVAAAAAYTNTATVGFDSLSGAGGRTGNASGSATISTPTNVIGLSKSYVSTTIPETGTAQYRPGVTDLNVGERAVIDLTASFTEGTTGSVVLTDQLPLTGKFQIVGTPTITYLGGVTSTVPGTLILSDTDGDGLADRLSFDFGTVMVPVDGDPTNNLIRIRYEVLVPDIGGNGPGAALTSPAMLTTAAGNASATLLTDLVAPNVTITKAVSAGSADAGDIKTYTVTITNAGTGPAFDLTIADALPAGLTAVAGTTVLTVGGVSTTFASPGAVPLASLGVGQSAVLTFNAVIGEGIVAGSTLTNTATVSYDSLAGVGGHAGGAAATASFATAAVQTLDKAVVASSESFTGDQFVRPGATDLTIGERATFELTTSFSEGTTNNVVITDQLVTAAGVLTFTGTPTLVLPSGATITGSVTPQFIDINGDGVPDQVRFVLGNVTIPGDNNPANNIIRIRYDAVLSNVAANIAGNQLTLPATLTSSTGSLTDSEPVDIVAPVLTLAKALAPDQPTDGQTTAFLLTIGHATGSTASATNIALTELLPPGALLAGVTVVSGPAGITINGNVITIPQLDLGQTVVIRIVTGVDFSNPPSGDTINRAGIAYGTLSGTTPGGRAGVADAQAILPFGNPTTTLPGMLGRQEMNEIGSMGSYLDARYIEDFPEIDPVYSGSAAPGTFVTIDVSDDSGSASGFGTATADAGGNWLIRLPSTTMSDRIERSRFEHHYDGSRLFRSPNADLFDDRGLLGFNRMGERLAIGSKPSFATQIVRINVAGQAGGFDTSFAPAWRDQFFSMEPGLSVQGIFRDRAGDAVENLYEGLASPEAAGLNRFNREFLTTADF